MRDGLLSEVSNREHRFNVNHRCAVDRFDGTDPQSALNDLPHVDAMKSNRIGPVRRSRRKNSCERARSIRARMNLEHVAPCSMQPGYNDDVVAGRKPVKTRCYERTQLEPGVRTTFKTLFWSRDSSFESRPDNAYRAKPCT